MTKSDYDNKNEYDLDFPPNQEMIESEMIKPAELCDRCGEPINKCRCDGYQHTR